MAERKALTMNTLLWLTTVATKPEFWKVANYMWWKKPMFWIFSQYSSQLVPAAMGVRRNFSRGVQHPQCSYPFQVADDTMQLDVHKIWPFPHHKQNTQCYGNSHKNRTSLAAPLLSKQYKTAWLTPYRYQQSLPRCISCQRSLHSTVTCSVAWF